MEELHGRKRKQFEEPPAAFAHDIDRLVRLAYPEFDSGSVIALARDAFLDGLSREFQSVLRRDKTANPKGVKELAEKVNQLRLAGIPSASGWDMEIYNDMSSARQTVTAFGNDSLDTQATVQSMCGRGRRWTPRRKYQQPRDPMLGKRCYICGDVNHLRSSCPYFHDCHRCLRPGHVARNCTAAFPASKKERRSNHQFSHGSSRSNYGYR